MNSVIEALEHELRRKEIAEEAERLSANFRDFIPEAWKILKPGEEFMWNWHIDAMCEYLGNVTNGQIKRLQIWLPPVRMKTLVVSVLWPAWEWTHSPHLRYWGASYETRFAGRISALSRDLIMSDWYQERWGDKVTIVRDAEHYFTNTAGGTRLATSPESTGQGEHGHRILIDDPINAKDADATSQATLSHVANWYESTVDRRGITGNHARVIVMQRLHEYDLAGYVLELEPWDVLCLPERFEADHPYRWPGDPRADGDWLWPEFDHAVMKSSHRAAGQLQQRPAAREGEIMKRHWWRFYDKTLFVNEKLKDRRPNFRAIVQSVDTPLKDKDSSDLVAIQAWGVVGADRYLLDLKKGHMSFSQAKRAIVEQARHVRRLYPRAAHYCLIENAGYGVELITELKREITGVQKLVHQGEGDKVLRAEAAAADLESGNCFLPGRRLGSDEFSLPDEGWNSADINDFIDSLARFPNARNDDDVDAWSQCMNWLRSRPMRKMRLSSPLLNR